MKIIHIMETNTMKTNELSIKRFDEFNNSTTYYSLNDTKIGLSYNQIIELNKKKILKVTTTIDGCIVNTIYTLTH